MSDHIKKQNNLLTRILHDMGTLAKATENEMQILIRLIKALKKKGIINDDDLNSTD